MPEPTRCKTIYEICEMKRDLEKESPLVNETLRKYVRIYHETGRETKEWVLFCETGYGRKTNPSSQFRIRNVQWEGLEKVFLSAGYKVLRSAVFRM
jgi:hypothetical protein